MHLLQLPPELLLRVSFHLTTPELGHLRQTCKQVDASLFPSFAKEFFTKRQFMIEHVSLQALLDISNHPIFSKQLSEIIISLHTFCPDPSFTRPAAKRRYKAGQVSRDILIETGRARDMLVEAISKLPNLRTVGLRDYDARGRSRDGEDARWRSYGWSYAYDPDSTPPQYSQPEPFGLASPETTFPLLLYALGSAGAKLEAIDVFLRRRAKLTPGSFSVLSGPMGIKTIPVVANLKRLMLTIALNDEFYLGAPWTEYDDEGVTEISLKHLLGNLSNVETLRLNFDPSQFFAYRILEWLGRPASTVTPAAIPNTLSPIPVSLPNLTGLDLGMLNVPGPVLVKVITKFDLVTLNLWKVTLHSSAKTDLHKQPSAWTYFFNDLADALPASTRLKSVLVGYVSQGCYRRSNENIVRIYFTSPDRSPGPSDSAKPLDKVAYKARYGSSIQDWLRTTSDLAIPEPLEETSDEDSDHDDDSEDEFENESEVDDDDMDEDD